MLILLASALSYLFLPPQALDSTSSPPKSPSKDFSTQTLAQPVLKIASAQPNLAAFVNYSSDNATYVQMENNGSDQLRKIKVTSDGNRVVGVLSQLDPMEKKVLVIISILAAWAAMY